MRLAAVLFCNVLCASPMAAHAQSILKPAEVRFGATTAEMQKALEDKCAKKMTTRRIDPPFLPNVRDRQLQIDCDGFPFFGKPRWTEFVIRDDALEMVWIMVREAEQDAILAAMTASYGPPTHRSADFIAFTNHRTAWRFKPAEVLFYSEALAPAFLADFEQRSDTP